MARHIESPKQANFTLQHLRERGRELREGMRAETTRRGYDYDWRAFCAWTQGAGLADLPAATETVELYIVSGIERGLKVNSVSRQASAIAHRHRQAGLASPVTAGIRELLNGARRIRKDTLYQMRPLAVDQLRQVSEHLGQLGDVRAQRDRAILLLGFGSALRRSTLTELELRDIEFEGERLLIHIRSEKQDQEGRGRFIGIPAGTGATCAVVALRAWLTIRGDHAGAVFTHLDCGRKKGLRPAMIREILRKRLTEAGIEPTGYAAHSLRSGFVTAAGESGASDMVIASHTGHRSLRVLRGYFRPRDVWRANACAMISL